MPALLHQLLGQLQQAARLRDHAHGLTSLCGAEIFPDSAFGRVLIQLVEGDTIDVNIPISGLEEAPCRADILYDVVANRRQKLPIIFGAGKCDDLLRR